MTHVNFISESGKIPVVSEPCEEITDARTEELWDLIQVCGDKSSRVTQPLEPDFKTTIRIWKTLAWIASCIIRGKMGNSEIATECREFLGLFLRLWPLVLTPNLTVREQD